MTRRLAYLGALVAVPALAEAQASQCEATPRNDSTKVASYQLPSGNRNTFIGGGVTFRCRSRGITLVADSAESYGDEGRIFMLGNVRYNEPRLRVTADYITYFSVDERVVAAGNVVATLPSGSTLRGPQAEYRRASTRVRPVAELNSIGRPTVTIIQQPARNATPAQRQRAQEPTNVTANILYMRGDSLLYASGQVDIVRPDFGATGDSVFMNTGTQYMRLMRSPAIEGKKGRPFKLTGEVIDLFSRDKQLDRVLSMGAANAVSEDLTLTSDTIDLRVREDLLQAAYAWGKSKRSEAVSRTQRIAAESISVAMPQQRVREMTALGAAYAEADPDTVKFRTNEKDWLRGDTIVAHFDTVPGAPADSAGARIRELTAIGDARSYQHLPPADSTLRCPAINYVRGDTIHVTFKRGEFDSVRVTGRQGAPGVLIEPTDSLRADCGGPPRADSTVVAPVRPAPTTPSPAPTPTPTTPPGRPPVSVLLPTRDP